MKVSVPESHGDGISAGTASSLRIPGATWMAEEAWHKAGCMLATHVSLVFTQHIKQLTAAHTASHSARPQLISPPLTLQESRPREPKMLALSTGPSQDPPRPIGPGWVPCVPLPAHPRSTPGSPAVGPPASARGTGPCSGHPKRVLC